jgi:hypothetical protein
VGKKDISLLFFLQTEVKSSGKEGYFCAFLLTNRGKIKWKTKVFLAFLLTNRGKIKWERRVPVFLCFSYCTLHVQGKLLDHCMPVLFSVLTEDGVVKH